MEKEALRPWLLVEPVSKHLHHATLEDELIAVSLDRQELEWGPAGVDAVVVVVAAAVAANSLQPVV